MTYPVTVSVDPSVRRSAAVREADAAARLRESGKFSSPAVANATAAALQAERGTVTFKAGVDSLIRAGLISTSYALKFAVGSPEAEVEALRLAALADARAAAGVE